MSSESFWNFLGAISLFVAAGALTTMMSIAALNAVGTAAGPMCHSAGCVTIASR